MYAQEIIEHAIDRTSIFVAKRTAEGATLTPLDLERYYGAIMRNNRNAQLENVYIEITTHDYGPHWRRGIAFVLVDACERKSAS